MKNCVLDNNSPAKKSLLFCLFILFYNVYTPQNFAQQVKDTIGFAKTATNSYGPARINSTTASSFSTKVIHLYTQSDLAAIGVFPGAVIQELAWQKHTTTNLINGASVQVKVSMRSGIDSFAYGTGVTSKIRINDYVGNFFSLAGTATFAANGTNLPADSVWVPIAFSAPFTYTGGGLEVLTDAVFTNGSGNPAAITWRNSDAGMVRSIYTNSTAAYNNTADCNISTLRPNTIFTYVAGPSCNGSPSAGTIEIDTLSRCPDAMTVNLYLKGAAAATGIKVQWEKKTAGQSSFSAIAGANAYELFNTTVNEATEFRAVVSCGSASSTSAAINIVPSPYLPPPYSMDFQTATAWTSATLPGCWRGKRGILERPVQFLTVNGSWASDGWQNSGTLGAARLSVSRNLYDWLISPGIDLGMGNWQLEFDLGIFNKNAATPGTFDEDDFFAVVVSTDGGKTWSSEETLKKWGKDVTPLSQDGTKHIVLPLAAYTGKIMIGFYATGGSLDPIAPAASPDVMIDNVQIVPGCAPFKPGSITGPTLVCRGASANYGVPQGSGVTSYTWILPDGWPGTSNSNSISTRPTKEGQIRVVANNSCGVSDTQTLAVSLSAIPDMLPAGDSLLFCSGTEIHLFTGSAGDYTWLKDGTAIPNVADSFLVVTESGNYRIIVKSGDCRDTSAIKNITINPLPEPVIMNNNNELSTQQSYNAYQWYVDGQEIPGATKEKYTVTYSGTYSVRVWDAEGCTNGSGGEAVEIKAASVGEEVNKKAVYIYPNPVNHMVTLYYNNPVKEGVAALITDINGKVLLKEKVVKRQTALDMSLLAPGIYFISLEQVENPWIEKIIKR